MGHVKKSATGFTAFWRENGNAKRKTFEGPMAFTEAHRHVRDMELEQGIVRTAPVQKTLFSKNHKTTLDVLPNEPEPGIPFTGKERQTNTGFRNIYYSEVGGEHFGVSVMDLSKKKRIAKKIFVKKHGGKQEALTVAREIRDEVLFRNQRIREAHDGGSNL